jgi:hypothetical protein
MVLAFGRYDIDRVRGYKLKIRIALDFMDDELPHHVIRSLARDPGVLS